MYHKTIPEVDYSVATTAYMYMYPPVAQICPFPPSLRSYVIACYMYALLHTYAYQISKESTMFTWFAESRPNTNLLHFHASWNVKIFYVLCVLQNFNSKFIKFVLFWNQITVRSGICRYNVTSDIIVCLCW
jgi:hypothetical protein